MISDHGFLLQGGRAPPIVRKWSYGGPINGLFNAVITPLSGVIISFKTARGPPCFRKLSFNFKPQAMQDFKPSRWVNSSVSIIPCGECRISWYTGALH